MSRLVWQVANEFYPEYRRTRRYIEHYVRLTSEEAASKSRESLYQYLNYCRKYSTYWRGRWPPEARDFTVDETEEVLKLLKPLNKTDLRENQVALRITPADRESRDGFPPIGRQKQVRTGGTTGVPVVVFQDDNNDHQTRATIDFFYRSCGLIPGTPFFYVWGSNNELSDLSQNWRKRISSSLRGIHAIQAFSLTPEKLRSIDAQMRKQNHVESAMFFVSALETLLTWAERDGVRLRRLKRVLTGGGLLHDELRRKTKEYLADEVFDVYGTRDFGLIACETPSHDGLSVASWLHHVEVLDAQGQHARAGELGQVHITPFWNYSFALIRAATGDTAQWYPASKGDTLPLPKLKQLSGRVAEHLRGPNDTVIDPSAVIHMIGVLIAPPWLRKFQLAQHSPLSFELRVESWDHQVSLRELDDLGTRVREGLNRLVSASVSVKVVRFDAIPPAFSGKHLYCVQSNGEGNAAQHRQSLTRSLAEGSSINDSREVNPR